MKDGENKFKQLQYEMDHFNQEDSLCNGVDTVSIIVHKKKVKNRKKYRKNRDLLKYGQQPAIAFRISRSCTNKTRKLLNKHTSMPEINKRIKFVKQRTRSSDIIIKKKKIFSSKFVVNRVSGYHFNEYLSPFNFPIQKKWKVYRCQLSSQEDSCCCSCNSDAMFEVMKSLYDCYKKKNCDNCNCILCGHLPREERRLGEIKKSFVSVGLAGAKERKAKIKKAEKALRGAKTKSQKEKILQELAKTGEPLPEGKTASEKALIQKVRAEYGLPPEPKTAAEKARMIQAEAAGVMTPLEGKTASQKEKILKVQAELGIPLPEGRTASEKALIQKVKTIAGIPEGIPSEKMRKAKATGLITPLAGKSPEQKEKILRGLAMQGLPLPEGKTASEKKLINNVRTELGLPPEPKSPSIKEKYANAANAGLIQPLEGKSPKEKEKILQGLADMGIPLPEGRTTSEKALITKVKARTEAPLEVVVPSGKIRKAKAAGLLTPLEGKTPEQKEKILKGLAMQGLPLPEAKTASEKKLTDKVRAELGLPPEPKSQSMKEKYDQSAEAGFLQPLEGKSTGEKEKILQGLHDMRIPLPEGRTASEKALIAKVKAGPRAPTVLAPSEKLRKAKAAGLLSPLEGKTPAEKEKIFRGLAMQGIPLPEGKTSSERKLIDKVRAGLGLPPEPKSPSMRDRYSRAADAGLLQPLEGKSPTEKERILQGLHDMGIPLPEGRTASEKVLIGKVKTGAREPPALALSEKIRKAKAAGLLTPLEGKTPEQKEKILRGLAMQGIPFPEEKTASERKLIDKVRAELGLPPKPKSPSMKEKYSKAADAGFLQPLEGKSSKEKERILRGLHDMGIPLPEGRSASEKALIAKVKTTSRAPTVLSPSEKLRKAKAGLLTPLADKSPAQREKILRGLAMQGVALPEAKTASEKMLVDKIRTDLGLPPEPKTPSMKERYTKAADAGLLQPLEGKSAKKKERILQDLQDMGIPLPIGRTASEKALVAKVKAGAPSIVLSEKLRKVKTAGLLTPLEGKTPAQKEKIIRGLAMQGLPFPEGKTASERKLIDKVRVDLGLPPEPKTPSMKEKYAKVANAGLLQPLEGKSLKEKERILHGLHDMGIPLPEGRTASEKALIAKVKAEPRAPLGLAPSEKLRKAKAAGLLTPLDGKTAEQKEKVLRGMAMHGIPLPEGKTASEKKLVDKVRTNLGLPPVPKIGAEKEKYNKAIAAGLITPLEGKSPEEKERILRGQYDLGLPLPEGRTASEKALIKQIKARERRKTRAVGIGSPALPPEQRRKLDEKTAKVVKEGKGPADECICGLLTPESERETAKTIGVPSKKLRAAKSAGLLTPLEGKAPEQKEKILRGLVRQGLPLPEAKTASEKKITDKIRADLGLPPEPRTPSMKERYARAQADGLITPLEGKTAAQKEKILRGQAEIGLPLPEGRTQSEKALIAKIKTSTAPSITTEKLRKAKAAGLLTPLEGKTTEQKENILKGLAKSGLPLPEGRTVSEKALVKKIKTDLGIPERTPSEKIRKAKTAGLLTPLEGKTHSQKERILRGRAAAGLPLPVGRTPSERAIIQKIKEDTGYVTPSPSERMKKAKAAGLLTPLEGKTPSMKEKILRDRVAAGVPIPEGKTPSEKEILRKITAGEPAAVKRHSEKLRQAKAAGALTPLEGKTPEQKEKILRGLIKVGLPMPEPKTTSEKDLMDKIRQDLGLPPEPKTPSLKERYRKAQAAGIITPLEGKSPAEKEKILKRIHEAGIPLPEGRTPSEKSMVKRIKAELPERKIPSEKIKAAKTAGLLTPLEGKTTAQKKKILKGLAKSGMPLPEGKTASEKDLIKKVRIEMGLPPEPTTASLKDKMQRAQAEGIITPLEGKNTAQKEKILKGLAEAGIPLPEGRTASEKALIAKVKAESKTPTKITSEKLRQAKAAGLLTPLTGKSPKEKEKILRGLIKNGLPLPEAQTASEKKVAEKIRKELGLPPEPKTTSERDKMRKAEAAGIITPLEGKTPSQKERTIKGMAEAGIPLPQGRTASEKAMIKKVKAEVGKLPPKAVSKPAIGSPTLPPEERIKLDKKTAKVIKEGKGPSDECICSLLTPEFGREKPPSKIPSKKIKKAKAAGLLTPLEGKTAKEKEKIMRGLVKQGLPLPEAKTASERKITDKIRKEIGLPPEPETQSMKEKHERAAAAGVLVPLEGLSPAEKERILRAQAKLGIPLPEGRTPPEKALIAKVKAEIKAVPSKIPSDKIRKAKTAGLLTPLEGQTAKEKDKLMRGLVKQGLPLPEAKTASERKIAEKIRKELGLPPEPKTPSMREKYERAAAAGVLVPLEGLSPAEKERVLRDQKNLGILLPEGRTASEKALIAKIKAEQEPSKIPSEKLRKAKAAGLLTPLEGKTHAQKEKIIRDLAVVGIPLPEGKTASEKALIHKVRTELGVPPPAKTASEKAVVRKAKAEGLLTPLAGKSAKEKERILKGLADAGLPIPEGKTASEKEMIKKVRTEAGLPPEPTPSEKRGEIKTKSKKIGISTSKKLAKAAGIGEEYEDIIKTTTCDRGCGCDKKKIRFKHSYVKIRVTSPDISSLCPCPNECLPGVKAGAFIDNEGIKVTVGRVDGVTSYTSQFSNHILKTPKNIITLYNKILTNSFSSNTSIDTVDASFDNTVEASDFKTSMYDPCPYQRCLNNDDKLNDNLDSSCTYTSGSYDNHTRYKTYKIESDQSLNLNNNISPHEKCTDESDRFVDTSRYTEPSRDIYRIPASISSTSDDYTFMSDSSHGSFDSILVIKSESSLSFTTNSSESMDVISVVSLSNSNYYASSSTHYLYCPVSDGHLSDSTVEESERFTNSINYNRNDDSGDGTMTSGSSNLVNAAHFNKAHPRNREYRGVYARRKQNEYFTYRLSQTKLGNEHNTNKTTIKTNNGEPVIVINNLDNEHDITTMVDQLLTKDEFSDASSIFVVVPTSDDNDSDLSSDSLSSTICIQLSEHYANWNQKHYNIEETEISSGRNSSTRRGLKISAKGKKYCLEGMQETVASFHNKETMFKYKPAIPNRQTYEDKDRTKNKLCQISTPEDLFGKIYHGVSTDTTSDRPCCCPKKSENHNKRNPEEGCVANVVSELITPLLVNQGLNCDGYRRTMRPAINVTQQASYKSISRAPTSVSPCQIPPCSGRTECHSPSDMRQFPFSTSKPPIPPKPAMPGPVPGLQQSQPCQCSPEKFKQLLEQAVKAGKTLNMKSTGCGGAVPNTPQASILTSNIKGKDEDCGTCPRPKYKEVMKMQCTCSGKKKSVKLRALCPCEQHQPPVSQTVAGPKTGTVSLGCQCCICDNSTLKGSPGLNGRAGKGPQVGTMEILGPAGGISQIEPGGTYTQAGLIQAQTGTSTEKTSTRKDCVCNGKRGKKKIICECPPEEPEPEPLDFLYDQYESYQWIDEKQIMRQKSDMTQTHSGFKMFKKKKPPAPPEVELTVEDAVRYYATMNPSLLKDLVPPPEELRERPDFKECTCEDDKRRKKLGVDCACPYEPPPPPPPTLPEEEPVQEEGPFGGFKFSMGGKGSASKGLSGVCCFDMMQETIMSRHPNE